MYGLVLGYASDVFVLFTDTRHCSRPLGSVDLQ